MAKVKNNRRKREQDEFIDSAIQQDDGQIDAATVPVDPLTPPQPGMVPIGWIWPQQGAVANTMETGDTEMAGLSPDGGALSGDEDLEDIDVSEDDEEEDLMKEFYKRRMKQIREASTDTSDKRIIKSILSDWEEGYTDEEVLKELISYYKLDKETAREYLKKAAEDGTDETQYGANESDEIYEVIEDAFDSGMSREEVISMLEEDYGMNEADIETVLEDLSIEESYMEKSRRVNKGKNMKERKAFKEEEDMDMDEIDPMMPEDVDLDVPPEDDMMDDDMELDDVEGENFLDELGDIVVDINSLFADEGGDLDEVLPEIDDVEGEDLEGMDGDMELDDTVEEDMMDISPEEAEVIQEYRRWKNRKRVKEGIKYPAGDPKREQKSVPESEELIQEREARKKEARKIQARKALLKKRAKEKADFDPAKLVDPDQLDKEIGYDSVQSVIDDMPKSQIKESVRAKKIAESQLTEDEKFLKRYNEKKKLNWKDLLNKGLLG